MDEEYIKELLDIEEESGIILAVDPNSDIAKNISDRSSEAEERQKPSEKGQNTSSESPSVTRKSKQHLED